jgi:hypothetical protein
MPVPPLNDIWRCTEGAVISPTFGEINGTFGAALNVERL